MADNLQTKVVAAVDTLPPFEEQGAEYEAFKAQMSAADPDGWKETLQYMVAKGHARLRVAFPDGQKTVYIRKAR